MGRRSHGLFGRLIARLLALLLVAGAAAATWAWKWLDRPLALAGPEIELTVAAGESPRAIARNWVAAGVQTDARALYEWFRWSGQAGEIKAGTYAVEPGITPRGLLTRMVQGEEVSESVRLPEGWTLRQWRAELARAPGLKHDSAQMTEAQLMAAIGAPGVVAEGRFFPDTYTYHRGSSDLAVLKRAYQAMERQVVAAWGEMPGDTPLKSPEQALTLASIVEKETGLESDRPMVAAVFLNRLRLGMPLQTDPTVIYGLGERFDGNLKRVHLQTDGPYNTYLRSGLPPTPIGMPSLASLRAVMQPAATRALYFVARGDGSSEFSETLADHNRAVNKFQRGR